MTTCPSRRRRWFRRPGVLVVAAVAAALVSLDLLATEYVIFTTQFFRRYAGHAHGLTLERDPPWTLLEAQPARGAPLVAMLAAATLLLWLHLARGCLAPPGTAGAEHRRARGMIAAVSLLLVPAATVISLEVERARDPFAWDPSVSHVMPLPQCWILLWGSVGVAVTHALAAAVEHRSPYLSARAARFLLLGSGAVVLPWCVGVGGYALGWLRLYPSREDYVIAVLHVVATTGSWLVAGGVVAGLALVGAVLLWFRHDTTLTATAGRRVLVGWASFVVGCGASILAWPYALENARPFPYAIDDGRGPGSSVRGHGPDGPLPIARVTSAGLARAQREFARRPMILRSGGDSLLLDDLPVGNLRACESLENNGTVPADSELILTLRQRPAAEVWLVLDQDRNLAWRNVMRQVVRAGFRRCSLLMWHEEVLARPVMGDCPFGYWTRAHLDLVPVTGAVDEPTLARFTDHAALVEYVVSERRRGRVAVLALPPLEGPGRTMDR